MTAKESLKTLKAYVEVLLVQSQAERAIGGWVVRRSARVTQDSTIHSICEGSVNVIRLSTNPVVSNGLIGIHLKRALEALPMALSFVK